MKYLLATTKTNPASKFLLQLHEGGWHYSHYYDTKTRRWVETNGGFKLTPMGSKFKTPKTPGWKYKLLTKKQFFVEVL